MVRLAADINGRALLVKFLQVSDADAWLWRLPLVILVSIRRRLLFISGHPLVRGVEAAEDIDLTGAAHARVADGAATLTPAELV